MADKKISQFIDGGLVQTGDELAAVRGGDNYKVSFGSAAAYDAGQSIGELPILEDDGNGNPALPAVSGEQLTNLPSQPDPTVKISSADDLADFLENKITGSASITVTKETDSTGYESLRLDVVGSEAAGILIGAPFPVMTHIGAPEPSNAGSAKFIKLTASDAYNTGLLTSESVTGSAPLVVATAVIDYASSPMDGQTVHLLNTMEAVIRPRETAGQVQQDQMQRITGELIRVITGLSPNADGAIDLANVSAGILGAGGAAAGADFLFNSANSPNARVSSTTSGETRPKNVSAVYYMRIA